MAGGNRRMNRKHVLSRLILDQDLKSGAETGVGSGPTTTFLMEKHPELHWIGVDHFPVGFELADGTFMGQERQDGYRANYKKLVERFSPRLTHIDAPAPMAATQVPDGALDLVFIDDDHSYEGCRDAIMAWRPKLRPGGWLTGHDYDHPAFPGVAKAVNELVPGFKTDIDFVWLVQA